jgi:spermidine synthase
MRREQHRITHFYKGIGISLERLIPVVRRRGPFGQIALFRHSELGKVFVLNGEIQHVEAWAPLYHEPLVHLPAAFVPRVTNVLILGGGTLYAASEALKYNSVKNVVLFDHDPVVTETVAKHYPHAQACLNDKRFTLMHNDADSLLPTMERQFDLVINDGADLLALKLPKKRGTTRLSSAMARILKPSGVCADVVFRHLFERQRTRRTLKDLGCSGSFALSLVFLPEYHGVLHVLCMWGGTASFIDQSLERPKNMEQLKWMRNSQSSPCTYYDPRFLHYYLYLPRYFKEALAIKRKAA